MESENMRLELEAFLNRALEGGRAGWPVLREDVRPMESRRRYAAEPVAQFEGFGFGRRGGMRRTA